MSLAKYKYQLIIVLVSAGMLLLQHCQHTGNMNNREAEYEALLTFEENERNALIQDRDLKAQEVVTLKQNVVSEKMAKKYVEEQFDGFKKVQSYMRVELLNRINDLTLRFNESPEDEFKGIQFVDSHYIHKDIVKLFFMRVPKTILFQDDWTYFEGTVNSAWGGFTVDSLAIIEKLDAVFGYKKPEDKKLKFLRKSKPYLTLKSYNPNTSVPYINNLTVDDDRTALGKLLTSRGAFFVYGFGVNVVLNKTTPGWAL